jgi:hypothetical protein
MFINCENIKEKNQEDVINSHCVSSLFFLSGSFNPKKANELFYAILPQHTSN